jgi:sugar phosphate isomerase/epimerase
MALPPEPLGAAPPDPVGVAPPPVPPLPSVLGALLPPEAVEPDRPPLLLLLLLAPPVPDGGDSGLPPVEDPGGVQEPRTRQRPRRGRSVRMGVGFVAHPSPACSGQRPRSPQIAIFEGAVRLNVQRFRPTARRGKRDAMKPVVLSRRTALTASAVLPFALAASRRPAFAAAKRAQIPVGLELYSLKDDERKDMIGTLRAVKQMGYDGVEFWAPYFDWPRERIRDLRMTLDDIGLRCFSTHNRNYYFSPDKLDRIIDYNLLLGSRHVVMAHPGKVESLDGWKQIAEILTTSHARFKKAGLRGGYHNHGMEWKATLDGGKRPIDVLTAGTPKDFGFQVDTATCLAAGGDPVAFTRSLPGRVKSYHLKDWSNDPAKGYKVLLGEGIGDWPKLLDAAESVGGVEFYLIEQEGSRLSPMETVKTCLDNLRAVKRG